VVPFQSAQPYLRVGGWRGGVSASALAVWWRVVPDGAAWGACCGYDILKDLGLMVAWGYVCR
jgi:hypothetical protein